MKTALDDVKKFNMSNKSRMNGSLLDNPKTIQEKLRWLNIYDIPWSDEYSMPLKIYLEYFRRRYISSNFICI